MGNSIIPNKNSDKIIFSTLNFPKKNLPPTIVLLPILILWITDEPIPIKHDSPIVTFPAILTPGAICVCAPILEWWSIIAPVFIIVFSKMWALGDIIDPAAINVPFLITAFLETIALGCITLAKEIEFFLKFWKTFFLK